MESVQAMKDHDQQRHKELESELKQENRALEKRLRKAEHQLIHHSDRGLQYFCYDYIRLLSNNHIKISMTENGDPYENAVAERVNGILKDEFGLDAVFEGKDQLYKQVHQAIELYNQMRLHSSVNMLTPRQAHSNPKIFVKRWKKKEPSK